jgi:hypothetical protein
MKTHPYLRPYDELTEAIKDLDRATVDGIPAILTSCGQHIRREIPIRPGDRDDAAAASGSASDDRISVLHTALSAAAERQAAKSFLDSESGGLVVLINRPLHDLVDEIDEPADRATCLALIERADYFLVPPNSVSDPRREREVASRPLATVQSLLGGGSHIVVNGAGFRHGNEP